MKICPVCKGVVSPAFKLEVHEHDHTIRAFESFLHDVLEGESNFEDVLNIMGYNELKLLVERAKAFVTVMESYARVTTAMDKDYLKVVEERDYFAKLFQTQHDKTEEVIHGNDRMRKALGEIRKIIQTY